ncbi:unnamed protein product [Prunus armeniaca]|uniref:Cation-transporting P-type ATPase C-terminal domain-containing protein n=1 Tax=Prunus armeniaca TaxID=36596 RepID=A0A6J5VTF8_PRUAR|nr:unnamed protein product [Prunus armeniaca]
MIGKNMNSPGVLPSHQQNDLEAGPYKDAPIQRINRWRHSMSHDMRSLLIIGRQSNLPWMQAKIVFCASRQFLQILIKEGEEASSKVHPPAAVQAENASEIKAGEEVRVDIPQGLTSTTGDFGIGREELDASTKNDDVGCLEQYGGASPTYTPEKSTSFMTYLWEACRQDISLIIFIVVAVASSVMGIVTKGTRFGYWEEGGNIAAVVMVDIIVKAICKYRQSLIHNVKEEGRNMYVKVTSVGICTKSELSQDTGNKTTLEENVVATSIGNVGLAVAFIAMMVLLLRWFTGHNFDGSPKFIGVKTKPRDVIEEVNEIIIIAITIAVAAVPQGLPLAVTLTIVSATKRMVADKAFVRRSIAFGKMAFAKNLLCDETVLNLNEVLVSPYVLNEMQDLCPQGVIKEQVQQCQRAGVVVRMVTGENLPTAKTIALECGILGSDDADATTKVFDGGKFCTLTDVRRQELAQSIKVMALCSPDVKVLFVQALRKSGEMVAVTGYVTDDADALLQADIGLALGKGTDIAKESSDIIILDDKFATCVELQLTVNVVALTTNFMAVFYGHVPLNAIKLLWVNLLIVGLVPLSLVIEPPADELMQGHGPGQPPKRYIKLKRLVFQEVYQVVSLLIINFQGRSLLKSYTSGHAIKVKNTMIFNTFVVCQIIHELEARKKGILSKPKKWITSNYLFMGIAGTILTSQFIIIEFLGKAFSTVALNEKEWQFSLTLGFSEMLFAIILFIKDLPTHKN